MGRLARQQENYEEARTRAKTALAVYATMENAWNVALALWDLGRVEHDAKQPDLAHNYYQQALQLLEQINAPVVSMLRNEMAELDNLTS